MTATEEQLRLEVRELTDLLRSGDALVDLREVLTDKGLSASEVILVGYLESEDELRYGMFLMPDDACVVFEIDRAGELLRWDAVENVADFSDEFGAAAVGVAMKARGEIA